MVTLVRLLQLSNAFSPMLVTVLGIVMVAKEHILKADLPILVTLFGIVTLFRLMQQSKTLSPIDVTPLGIVMLVRLVQFWNALIPILFTLSGMVTLGRLIQSTMLTIIPQWTGSSHVNGI